jgi:uncharacterized protein YfaS (alpha-2-macroglobulin family)
MTRAPVPLPQACLRVLALAALVTLASCGRDEAVVEPAAPPVAPVAAVPGAEPVVDPAASPLRLLFHAPTGVIRGDETISLVFDRPMVALTTAEEESKVDFVTLDPAVPGRWRWVGDRLAVFAPDERFPLSTRVTVAVGTAAKGLAGAPLAEPVTFTFETPAPTPRTVLPSDDRRSLEPRQPMLVFFDQPVRQADVESLISLTVGGRPFPFVVRRPTLAEAKAAGLHWEAYQAETGVEIWEGADADQEVMNRVLDRVTRQGIAVVPEHDMPLDADVDLDVAMGLKGEGGNLGTTRSIQESFRTYGPLRLESRVVQASYLPSCSVSMTFANPLEAKTVEPRAVTSRPRIADTQVSVHGRQIVLYGHCEPDVAYVVSVAASVRDRFGQPLTGGASVDFRTPHLRGNLRLADDVAGTYERFGRVRSVPLSTVNVEKAAVDWYRLTAETLVPFLRSVSLWETRDDALAGRPGVMRWRDAEALRWDARRVQDVPLRQDDGPAGGAFFLQAFAPGFHPWGQDEAWYSRHLFNVTDLGLVAKRDDKVLRLAATSFRNGGFLADVPLQVRDQRNEVLWSGVSRSDGWTVADVPPPSRVTDGEADEHFVVAAAADELTWLRLEGDDEIGLWGRDIDVAHRPERLRAALWTDKGIYRKGETVHLTGVVREVAGGALRVPRGVSLAIRVASPSDETVFEQNLLMTGQDALRFGAFDVPLDVRPEWRLGTYRATVTSEGLAADASFDVGVYRKPSFAVEATLDASDALPGQTVKAAATARYYFGAPLADAPVVWRATSDEQAFVPPGHEGFSFGTPPPDDQSDRTARTEVFEGLVSTENARTDADGRTAYALSLPSRVTRPKRVVIEGEVRDLAGHPIAASQAVWLHPAAAYLGLSTDRYFYDPGTPVVASFVAVDPKGAVQFGRKVRLALFREDWVREVQKGVGDRLDATYKRVRVPAGEQVLVAGEEPIDLEWKPPTAGSYALVGTVIDAAGRESQTEVGFYVLGAAASWADDDGDTFALKPDRPSYKPGDTARVMIKAPYTGVPALLTIERERVLEERLVSITGALQQVEIPITEAMRPDVYVSIVMPRGRLGLPKADEADTLYRPRLRLGVCRLDVDTSDKRLEVAVTPDRPQVAPGEEVTLAIQTSEAANLVVQVVDRSVLDLTGYRAPDLHDTFWGRLPLEVRTYSSYHRLLEQRAPRKGGADGAEKGDDVGGGGMAGGGGVRSDFRDVAFYAGHVATDAQGAASVTFRVPDNLTEYAVLVTAMNETDRFGSGRSSVRVQKPFLALPSWPRRVGLADRFTVTLDLQNLTDKAGEATAQLLVPPFLKAATASATCPVPANGSGALRFELTAAAPGLSDLQVEVRLGDAVDRLKVPIEVAVRTPVEETAFFGSGKESAAFEVRVPDDVVPDFGGLTYGVANSGLVGLEGAFRGLLDYPYGCTEQLSSRLVALTRAARLQAVADSLKRDAAALSLAAGEVAGRILARQGWDGGFAFWDGGKSYPYVSAWAYLALSLAQEAGVPVPEAALTRAYEYLLSLLTDEAPDGLTEPRQVLALKSYVVWTILRSGRVAKNLEDTLVQAADPLPEARLYLAWCLADRQGAGQTVLRLLEPVLNRVLMQGDEGHVEIADVESWQSGFGSRLQVTALLAAALVRFDPGHPMLAPLARWLVKRISQTRDTTTHDAAHALLALTDYYAKIEDEVPDFDVEVLLDGDVVAKDHLAGRRAEVSVDRLGMRSVPKGRSLPLEFSKHGPGRMYYSARLSYAPGVDVTAVAPQARGFLVERRAMTLDGKPLTDRVRFGEPYLVELDVVALGEQTYVVIDDALPAGVDAVQLDFATVAPSLRRAFYEAVGARHGAFADFQEVSDDSVRFFVDDLAPGLHRYFYLARPVHRGEYRVPGARAFAMYDPETFGSTRGTVLTVE